MAHGIRWLIALTVAGLGCSAGKGSDGGADAGDDGGGSLPSDPLDPAVACLALATAQAAHQVACGFLAASDVGDAGSGYVAAQCAGKLFGLREAAFDAGLFAFSKSRVQCVQEALQGLPCNTDADLIDPACGQLAWGTLGAGETCADDLACAGGLSCLRVSSAAACGYCGPDATLDDDCGATANGALCSQGACNGGTCRAFAGQGGGCDLQTAICEEGLTCRSGGCAPPGVAGDECGTDADCQDGLSCGAFTAVCATAPADGGSCAEQACVPGFACQVAGGGAACAPLVAEGPCVQTDAGPSCLQQETCHDGGCVPLVMVGQACQTRFDCVLGACTAGSCALVAAGADCNRDQDCESGHCDVGGSGICAADCE